MAAAPTAARPLGPGIDWIAKLRHMLQVMAFCLAISALHIAFQPERAYAPQLAYSLSIGLATWALIDFGRHLFPSAAETGWPQGWAGAGMVAFGIVGGFLAGTWLANQLCQAFGWYAAGWQADAAKDLRNSIIVSAVAGLAVTYYFYSVNKGAYLERKMGEARRHADEARLKLLEAQLEPHMLFNTLANLRALIGVDPARAQQMLDHMIAYLRATLDASRSPTHSLAAEFERLRDYLALMATRMGPRLSFSLEVPPQLAQHPVPTLLLQPLVENAIQHGLEPKVEGGRIEVSAQAEGGRLVLRVADTGVGFAVGELGRAAEGRGPGDGKPWIPAFAGMARDAGMTRDGAGMAKPAVIPAKAGIQGAPGSYGLTHIRERLAALYGDAGQLVIRSRPGEGTIAEIRLPSQGS